MGKIPPAFAKYLASKKAEPKETAKASPLPTKGVPVQAHTRAAPKIGKNQAPVANTGLPSNMPHPMPTFIHSTVKGARGQKP